jgi:hypothetical protein
VHVIIISPWSFGDFGFISCHRSKGRARDIIIRNKPFYGYKKRGFSIKDLVEHKDIRDAWIFDYISFTEPEIEKLAKYPMEEHDPPAIIKKEAKEEKRYEIADQSLAEIVKYCEGMLFAAKERILYKWRYIKGLDPETGELNWYGLVFGERTALDLFNKAKEERQSRKKDMTAATTIKHAKKVIAEIDKSIIRLHEEIMGPKYSATRNTYYPAIVKGLVELAYPPFCRKNTRRKR